MTVAREIARYKLDLVGVEEVRGSKGALLRDVDYIFFTEKEIKIISWEQDFLYSTE